MLVKDFIQNYYLPSIHDLAPSTRVGYESAINVHILPKWGEVDIENLTVFEMEEWLANFSGGCAEKVWSVFRLILKRGNDWGYIDNQIGRKRLHLPKKAYYKPPVLSVDELREVLKGFWGDPLEAWLICSVCLGLRRGESCGLSWGDIDLRTGEVRVNCSVQSIDGKILELPTKTAKSTRSIFLPNFAIKRLREIKGKKNERLIGKLSPNRVAWDYKQVCKKKHLPFVPASNLRHTFATITLQSGVAPTTVANILGHATLSMIYEHYLVPEKQIYKDAARKFEKRLLQG